MKRRIISLMAAILMFAGTSFGQVIYLDEDYNHNRMAKDGSTIGVMVPLQGANYDQWQYAPLDGGILLLAGLGAAYLVNKRKKE